jgi:hypothetical protein
MNSIFSAGKIILMGEYAVLHGSDALCLPLATGQNLSAKPSDENLIQWKWKYRQHILADFSLFCDSLESNQPSTGDFRWARALIELIRQHNPYFLTTGTILEFENFFPPEWGLGSSSATISSLCRMAGVDPYIINAAHTGGSGADIAATTAPGWFLYRKTNNSPLVWPLPFDYPHAGNSFFIYTGKKQATQSHVKEISHSIQAEDIDWKLTNAPLYRFLCCSTVPEAMKCISDHEQIIGNAIQMEAVGNRFDDFPGRIKSLGAWGGDYLLAVTQQDEAFVRNYFHQRELNTVFNWHEFTQTKHF